MHTQVGAQIPQKLSLAATEEGKNIYDYLKIQRVLSCSSSCFIAICCCADLTARAVCKSYTKARLDATEMHQAELEMQVHHQLQHNQHVVPFWLAAEDSSQLHIITQYCSEGDLRQKMFKSLSEAAVRNQVAKPLLQALTDLHSRGFVHRDVKPENCFLHSDQVLLGDFGLVALCNNVVPAAATTALGWDTQRNMLENSCLRSAGFLRCQESGGSSNILTGSFCSSTISESSSSDSLVQLHQQQHQDRQPRNSDSSTVGVSSCISPRHEAAGTPAYAAPEVLMLAFNTPSKCSAVGPQNDVWSLGVLVLECLSGRHPFAEHCDNPGALMWAVANSKEIGLEHLPVTDSCKQWLSAALAIDPAQRATAQQLLEHPWLQEQLPAAGAWEPMATSGHTFKHASQQQAAQLAGTCNDLLSCTAADSNSCFSTPVQLPGMMPGAAADEPQPWDMHFPQDPSAIQARRQNHTFDGAHLLAYGNMVTCISQAGALYSNSSSGCELYSSTGHQQGRQCDSAHAGVAAKASRAAKESQSSALCCTTQGCSQQYELGKPSNVPLLQQARSFSSWED